MFIFDEDGALAASKAIIFAKHEEKYALELQAARIEAASSYPHGSAQASIYTFQILHSGDGDNNGKLWNEFLSFVKDDADQTPVSVKSQDSANDENADVKTQSAAQHAQDNTTDPLPLATNVDIKSPLADATATSRSPMPIALAIPPAIPLPPQLPQHLQRASAYNVQQQILMPNRGPRNASGTTNRALIDEHHVPLHGHIYRQHNIYPTCCQDDGAKGGDDSSLLNLDFLHWTIHMKRFGDRRNRRRPTDYCILWPRRSEHSNLPDEHPKIRGELAEINAFLQWLNSNFPYGFPPKIGIRDLLRVWRSQDKRVRDGSNEQQSSEQTSSGNRGLKREREEGELEDEQLRRNRYSR